MMAFVDIEMHRTLKFLIWEGRVYLLVSLNYHWIHPGESVLVGDAEISSDALIEQVELSHLIEECRKYDNQKGIPCLSYRVSATNASSSICPTAGVSW